MQVSHSITEAIGTDLITVWEFQNGKVTAAVPLLICCMPILISTHCHHQWHVQLAMLTLNYPVGAINLYCFFFFSKYVGISQTFYNTIVLLEIFLQIQSDTCLVNRSFIILLSGVPSSLPHTSYGFCLFMVFVSYGFSSDIYIRPSFDLLSVQDYNLQSDSANTFKLL